MKSPGPYRRFGPYLLLRPLGRGGMGQVSLALAGEPGWEMFCVVKRVAPELRHDPAIRRRFADEVALARRLTHGRLARTQAVGIVEGELYLVQEYVAGCDLTELTQRCYNQESELSVAAAGHIVAEVALGLSHAHELEGLGLVHRDVTPSNIRLSYAGEIKLIDFGVATYKDKSRLTAPGGAVGKLAYLAPEQRTGASVDRRADIYSLGVILWELLTGRAAAAEPAPSAALTGGSLSLSLPSPSTVRPTVPVAFDEIVARCLCPRAEDRFATASALREALLALRPPGFDGEMTLAGLITRLFDSEAARKERERLLEEARASEPEASAASTGGGRSSAPSRTEPVVPTGGSVARTKAGALALAAFLGAAATLAFVWAMGPRAKPAPAEQGGLAQETLAGPVREAPDPRSLPSGTGSETGRASETMVTGSPGGDRTPPEVRPSIVRAPASAVPTPAAKGVPATGETNARGGPALPASSSEELVASASRAFAASRFEEALALARRAAAAGGGAPAEVVIGNVHFRERRYREAEEAYARALERNPDHPDARRRWEMVRRLRQRGPESPSRGAK